MNKKEWEKLADRVRKRDKNTCRKCGKVGKRKLPVHHIIPYKISRDHSMKNLITLCRKHHTKEENKYRRIGVTNYVRKMIKENILRGV